MEIKKLEEHIEKLEEELRAAKDDLERLYEEEQNSFKMPMPEVHNIPNEEIGKLCKTVSYFTAATTMSRQFGFPVAVPVEFASRSLAELIYRCAKN